MLKNVVKQLVSFEEITWADEQPPGYVLHDLEDKEEMAFCLCCHGDKVTVVFGLISRTHVYQTHIFKELV